MGLLAVDITAYGVVMSADSQLVEILGGENLIEETRGRQRRNPMVIRTGGGFVGLIGFAGTERIDGTATAEWLRRFGDEHADDRVDSFCVRLADRLTEEWQRMQLRSNLEILVTGEMGQDVQFWYVRNSQGLRPDGKHETPAETFAAVNDLDDNYIPKDRQGSQTKDDVLQTRMYSFMQGVLLPASPVFNAFRTLMASMYAGGVEGFEPLSSLDDVGHFARVRMEFLKRLCTAKYGIYRPHVPTPIAGDVHVLGVTCKGEIREYSKNGMKIIRPGRAVPKRLPL